MPDDGYEVMGPAVGVGAPSPSAPPYIAPKAGKQKSTTSVTSKKSAMSSIDSTISKSVATTTKSVMDTQTKKYTKEEQTSRMESADGEGTMVWQRPNPLDTAQLGLVIFITIITIAVSIPMLLVATGNIEGKWVFRQLHKK